MIKSKTIEIPIQNQQKHQASEHQKDQTSEASNIRTSEATRVKPGVALETPGFGPKFGVDVSNVVSAVLEGVLNYLVDSKTSGKGCSDNGLCSSIGGDFNENAGKSGSMDEVDGLKMGVRREGVF